MLVHHSYSKVICDIRVSDVHDLAVLADLSLLRLVQAEENAHEGGFSGAVLTEQRMDLTSFELERYIVISNDARETFRYVEHLNGIRGIHCLVPPYYIVEIIIL